MKIALRFPLSFKFLPLFAAAASIALSGCGPEKFATNGNTTSPAGNTAAANATADNSASTRDAQNVEEPPSKLGKYGGSLTDAALSDPKTFNLWVSADQGSNNAVGNLYDGLLARNGFTQKWEGRLAELPEVSADNLTYTFKLKPGVKWSDGQPITADDVIFTLDVIFDPKIQTNMREGMMLDAPDGKGGFKRVPLAYQKIDASTVQFKFPAPYAPAREILSFPIAPRHKLYSAWKSGNFNSTWGINSKVRDLISSGPLLLDSYVPGQRMVYKRNPNYWKKDAKGRPLPYIDRFVTLIVPDLNAITLKFRAGDTDVTSIQHTDYPSFKKGEAAGNYTTYNLGPSDATNFLSFNLNPKSQTAKQKPWLIKTFRDTRFRQAVAHAINRKRIIDQVFLGLATPLYGPETPANKQFYDPSVPTYPYDPTKAKALLTQMGLKDGDGDGILEMDGHDIKFNIVTNLENNQRKTMAAIVADSLKKVGLGSTFTPIAFNKMISQLDAIPQPGQPYPPYDWEAVILSFGSGGIDPNGGRNVWSSSGNLHQWYPYQKTPDTSWEAEIDKIFREGAQEMDEAKRKAMYDRWQQIAAEQQPMVFTVTPNVLVAARNKYGNLKPSNTAGLTWNQDEWFALDATRDTP